eukprot:gene5851-9050_t
MLVSVNDESTHESDDALLLQEEDTVSLRERRSMFSIEKITCSYLVSARGYLAFLSIFAFGQSMIISGLFPISVTSISRQFGYSNTAIGIIPAIYDAVLAIAAVFITHLGHRAHRPRWCSYAGAIFATGAIVLALPGFTFKPTLKSPSSSSASQLLQYICWPHPRSDACDAVKTDYSLGPLFYVVFLIGELLLGLGAAPIYNIGVSFMDDNVEPNKMSMYMAILFTCTALGPATGFLLGGTFLSIYVTLQKPPSGFDENSPGWVGAWWIGILMAAGIVIISIPFLRLFPRHLEGTDWIRALRKAPAAAGHVGNLADEKDNHHAASEFADDTATRNGEETGEHQTCDIRENDYHRGKTTFETDPVTLKLQLSGDFAESNVDQILGATHAPPVLATSFDEAQGSGASHDSSRRGDNHKTDQSAQIGRKDERFNTEPNLKHTSSRNIFMKEANTNIQHVVDTHTSTTDLINSNDNALANGNAMNIRSKRAVVLEAIATTATNVRELLRNKTFMSVSMGNMLDTFLVSGLGTFLPAFVETQFHLTSAEASFYSGLSIILGVTTGTLLGGALVRWFNWTARQTTLALAVFATLTLLTLSMFFINCETISLGGINELYSGNETVEIPTSPPWVGCSSNCHCSLRQFVPVCHFPTQVTYHSPCAAGCGSAVPLPSEKYPVFINCSCISHDTSESIDIDNKAIPGIESTSRYNAAHIGKCKGSCDRLVPFLVLLFFGMTAMFLGAVPSTQVHLRCVEERHRSLSLGLAQAISRLIGAVPGPIVIGALLDNSCILWEQRCNNTRGGCLEYNNPHMGLTLAITTLVVKGIGLLCYIRGWYTFPRHLDVPFQSPKEEVIALRDFH